MVNLSEGPFYTVYEYSPEYLSTPTPARFYTAMDAMTVQPNEIHVSLSPGVVGWLSVIPFLER